MAYGMLESARPGAQKGSLGEGGRISSLRADGLSGRRRELVRPHIEPATQRPRIAVNVGVDSGVCSRVDAGRARREVEVVLSREEGGRFDVPLAGQPSWMSEKVTTTESSVS